MKDILVTVLSAVIIVLIIILMFKGFSVGNVELYSIGRIQQESMDLDTAIENVNNLKNVTYQKALKDLETAISGLKRSKNDYQQLASVSTEDEIRAANQEQTYTMEFLWSKIGNYATDKGIVLKLEITSTGTSNTLGFTVVGQYYLISDFIYNLENDSELGFRIENFKMREYTAQTTTNVGLVEATFSVSNIVVKGEGLTATTTTSENNNVTTSTTTNTTNSTSKNPILNTQDVAGNAIDALVNP